MLTNNYLVNKKGTKGVYLITDAGMEFYEIKFKIPYEKTMQKYEKLMQPRTDALKGLKE